MQFCIKSYIRLKKKTETNPFPKTTFMRIKYFKTSITYYNVLPYIKNSIYKRNNISEEFDV